MKSIKAKMLYDNEDDSLSVKTVYINSDKITSFFIETPEEFEGKTIKCFGITCDGAYFSILPEPHVYQVLFDKFINNAIK